MSYILAIIGSRYFSGYTLILEKFSEIVQEHGFPSRITSGGAKGADHLAEEVAYLYQIPIKVYPADWERLGNRAGPIRNALIIDAADMVLAFPMGESPGTHQALFLAEKKGCPIFCYPT